MNEVERECFPDKKRPGLAGNDTIVLRRNSFFALEDRAMEPESRSQDRHETGLLFALAVIVGILGGIYETYLMLCHPEKWQAAQQRRKQERILIDAEAARRKV